MCVCEFYFPIGSDEVLLKIILKSFYSYQYSQQDRNKFIIRILFFFFLK